MKIKIALCLLAAAFIGLTAFKNPAAKPETYTVDVNQSTITWFGKKFTGSHKGTVALKSGTLVFDGKKLTQGGFIADMTSIKDADGSKGLEGHLKRDDFFGVDQFPAANFVIKKVSGAGTKWTVTGDLTIKGITNSVTFPATVAWNSDGSVTAMAEKITLDRMKYGIKFKSKSVFADLGDNFIYDEFEIGVKLVAKKSAALAK